VVILGGFIMKRYEIYNLTTGEILADNLTFEDMPELFGAYMEFYPEAEIIVCCRETKITVTCAKFVDREETNRKRFYAEWFNLMDELLVMDNIH
jgi:hypothetical protein